ncbi:MAG TPA: phosphatidate cytidylyltransferase [Thermodesulfovibrionales bacterium]|nr:phosphatidate cytidylyltransferase [Thermodesulfovibrionales bacterium]
MHGKRLLVAVIVLPLLYLYVTKLPQDYFFFLILLVSVVAQAEFYAMYGVRGMVKIAGIAGGIAVLAALHVSRDLLPHALFAAFLVISTMRLVGRRDPSSSLHDMAPVLVALLYIPCSLGFQLFLRTGGPEWIVFLFGSVWAADSLAFYIGKTFGKTKLYPEVSPNKTVAGAFGSLAGGAGAGWLLKLAFLPAMSSWKSTAAGFLIGATTIVGDLVESMFKRDAGVKDSGSIVPGHGGILDKIDGVLFAGPVLYWISRAFGLLT